jgi:hypothetical protein
MHYRSAIQVRFWEFTVCSARLHRRLDNDLREDQFRCETNGILTDEAKFRGTKCIYMIGTEWPAERWTGLVAPGGVPPSPQPLTHPAIDPGLLK